MDHLSFDTNYFSVSADLICAHLRNLREKNESAENLESAEGRTSLARQQVVRPLKVVRRLISFGVGLLNLVMYLYKVIDLICAICGRKNQSAEGGLPLSVNKSSDHSKWSDD